MESLDKENGLTMTHYKEPLRKVPQGMGFGYLGAILMTPDGDKMQCHVCGELFDHVASHARAKHALKAADYKERFGLARRTALVSENLRAHMKEVGKHMYEVSKDSRSTARGESLIAARAARGDEQPYLSLETKNKRGSCPDQILAKIQECKDKLGHTPTRAEFLDWCDGSQRFLHLIDNTFNGWKNALKMLGLESEESLRGGAVTPYTKEQLIEYLQLFHQEHDRIPTSSDCKRGLLPSESAYKRAFGSLPKARIAAGINS